MRLLYPHLLLVIHAFLYLSLEIIVFRHYNLQALTVV